MASSKALKRLSSLVGWLLLAAVIGGPIAYVYTREPVIDVTAVTLRRGRAEQTISAFTSGAVEPKRSSMIAAESMGKIVAIPVRKGARVNAGDVLVEIDQRQHELQVAQAEAHKRQSEIALDLLLRQAENDRGRVATLARTRDLAETEFIRDKTLYEQQDVGSESLVNLAELNFNQIDDAYITVYNLVNLYPLRIEEARSGAAAVAVMLDQARLYLDWARVRAPFSGIVADIFVEVGESVGSGFGSMPSGGAGLGGGAAAGMGGLGGMGAAMGGALPMSAPMAVAHLVDDSDLYVKAPFDEASYGLLEVGQKVRITVDAFREEEFPGRIAFIASTVTRNVDLSRTFEVEVLIEAGKERLIPGMSADVIVIAEQKDNVLLVPTEALVREEEGYVIENGRAARRAVKVGIGNWHEREVLGGLREGETLITSVGLRELRDGVRVNVVESLEQR